MLQLKRVKHDIKSNVSKSQIFNLRKLDLSVFAMNKEKQN